PRRRLPGSPRQADGPCPAGRHDHGAGPAAESIEPSTFLDSSRIVRQIFEEESAHAPHPRPLVVPVAPVVSRRSPRPCRGPEEPGGYRQGDAEDPWTHHLL